MNSFFSLSKRRGAMLACVFSVALSSVVLLCGAGSVPVENLLPQGAMQGDLNAGGHSLTNAATVSASNVRITGLLSQSILGTDSSGNLLGNNSLIESQGARWVKTATLFGTSTNVGEPSVLYEAGTWMMLFSSIDNTVHKATSTAPDSGWTDQGTVITGPTGFAGHGRISNVDGTLYYLWGNFNTPGSLRYVTSTDNGNTWSSPGVIQLDAPGGNMICMNPRMIHDGAVYRIFAERDSGDYTTSTIAEYTSTSALGAYAPLFVPLTSLLATFPTVCAPDVIRIGSQWGMYFHSQEVAGTRSQIYFATNSDLGTDNWTPAPGPVIPLTPEDQIFGVPADQVGNPEEVEVNGVSYMFYDRESPNTYGTICLATYAGTTLSILSPNTDIDAHLINGERVSSLINFDYPPNEPYGLMQFDGNNNITIGGGGTATFNGAVNVNGTLTATSYSGLPSSKLQYIYEPYGIVGSGYYAVDPIINGATWIQTLDPTPFDGETCVFGDPYGTWATGAWGFGPNYGSNLLIYGPDYSGTPCTTPYTKLTYIYSTQYAGWYCFQTTGSF